MIQEIYNKLSQCQFKISTDTRKIESGSMFFALKGDHFNGNLFAIEALEKGAKYAVVDEIITDHPSLIQTKDVLKTLQLLANFHRKQMKATIIGITGSNGKTTSKELIYAVLKEKYNVFATHGNLNNHIGVPLSLLSIKTQHDFAVIEMGANHQKEIALLCSIAEPDFGIINNIGKAHLEGFGGEEGVKKGKGEMYDFIKSYNKNLFVNADDALLMDMSKDINRLTYGTLSSNYISGKILDDSNELCVDVENTAIQSHLVGHYNFNNLLLACCIGKFFNVPLAAIKKGIETYVPSNSRSQLIKKTNNTIILDAYNANPSSMSVALENFSKSDFNNKIAVLGDMFELGEYSEKEHTVIKDLAESKAFEMLILCGKYFFQLKDLKPNTHVFETTDACIAFVKQMAFENKTILIKGSRSMSLEKLLEFIS
jgi:UDP-N-acetylmuramoyl-tripeptide--D-alanyl-D-alanine ligase